ncbi:hypothetical protein Agub_g13879 [Astrephomene gubernaculifera]|uniref:Uncharacterized protein n=1 Tax=Astrephomene gubernaculifera TaxID=47775 RepID=A0AAD3HSZ0_9CHLO|nr:hypothetical protein Agub_g13879 [Astrephomene gubernaculifera]
MGLTRVAQDPWSESCNVPTFIPPPVEVKSCHVPLTAERATEVVRSHLRRTSMSNDGQGDAADVPANSSLGHRSPSPRPPGIQLEGIGPYDSGAPTLSPSNQQQLAAADADAGNVPNSGCPLSGRDLLESDLIQAWMQKADEAQNEFTFGSAGGPGAAIGAAALMPRPPSGPPPLARRLSCPETLLQPELDASAGDSSTPQDALEPLANHHMWMYNRDRCAYDGGDGSGLLYSASSALAVQNRSGRLPSQKWQPRYAAGIFDSNDPNSGANRFTRVARLAAQEADPDALRSLAAVIIQSYCRGWRARRQAALQQAAEADERARRAAAEALARERAEVRRQLRLAARDCLLAVHAQQDYDRTRLRLAAARGLGPSALSAAPPPPPTIPPALWSRCQAMGLDPIQVLLDSGMRSQQIEDIINASQLAAQLPRRAAKVAAHLVGGAAAAAGADAGAGDGGYGGGDSCEAAREGGEAAVAVAATSSTELTQRAESARRLSQPGRVTVAAPLSPPQQLRLGSAVGGRQSGSSNPLQPSVMSYQLPNQQQQQQPQQQQQQGSAGQTSSSSCADLVDPTLLLMQQQQQQQPVAGGGLAGTGLRRSQPPPSASVSSTTQRIASAAPRRSASGSLSASPPRLPIPFSTSGLGPDAVRLSASALQAGMQAAAPGSALRGTPPCPPRGRSRRLSVEYVVGGSSGSFTSGVPLVASAGPAFASLGGAPGGVGSPMSYPSPMRFRRGSDCGAELLQAHPPLSARAVILPFVRQSSGGLDKGVMGGVAAVAPSSPLALDAGGGCTGMLGSAASLPATCVPTPVVTPTGGVGSHAQPALAAQVAFDASPDVRRRNSFLGMGLPPPAPSSNINSNNGSAGGAAIDIAVAVAAAGGSSGGPMRPMSPMAMRRSSCGGNRALPPPSLSPRALSVSTSQGPQSSGMLPLLPSQGSSSAVQGTGSGGGAAAAAAAAGGGAGGNGIGSGSPSVTASPALSPFVPAMAAGGAAAVSLDTPPNRMRRASNLAPTSALTSAAVGSPPSGGSPLAVRRLQSQTQLLMASGSPAGAAGILAAGATGISIFANSPTGSPARVRPSGPSGSGATGEAAQAAAAAASAALPGGYSRVLPLGPTRSQGQLPSPAAR